MARFVLANLLIAVTVSGADGLSASAQVPSGSSSPTQQTSLSTSNQTVVLDVIALDKHGEPVPDLKMDEFRLRVNKQEQKVDAVAYSDSEPVAVGFLFDISGSERGDRARNVELKEAGDFLHRIWRPGDESFIAAFNERVVVFSKPSGDLSDADKGLTALANAVPIGSTALYDAICAIKVDRASGLQKRTLVLVFSDFEDNASHIPLRKAPECAQKAGVRIYSVPTAEEGVSRRARKHALEAARQLSEETGGEIFLPKSKKDLSKIFAALSVHLRSGYAVSYSVQASDKPTNSERIELITSRKDVKLFHAKERFRQ